MLGVALGPALLLLPLVAEPHAHDVLLQVQLLRDRRDLLACRVDNGVLVIRAGRIEDGRPRTGRPRLQRKVGLETALLGRGDRGALALLLHVRQDARLHDVRQRRRVAELLRLQQL